MAAPSVPAAPAAVGAAQAQWLTGRPAGVPGSALEAAVALGEAGAVGRVCGSKLGAVPLLARQLLHMGFVLPQIRLGWLGGGGDGTRREVEELWAKH